MNYLYEAEKNIIGGILYFTKEDKYCKSALEQLFPSDFYDNTHREIFATMQKLFNGNEIIDIVTLKKSLPFVKNEMYEECISSCCTTANFNEYIKLIRSEAKGRRIRQTLSRLSDIPNDELINNLAKIIESESEIGATNDYKFLLGNQIIEFINELLRPIKPHERIYTGFSRIDKALGGLRKQTISMVGARPSTGKTAFALNVIRNQIKTPHKILMFSLEMTTNQILERLASDVSNVHYGVINDRNLTTTQKDLIGADMRKLIARQNFWIIDNVYSIEGIQKTISELKPDFVVIDFIQCVRTVQKFQSRRNEIDYISSELKRFAKQNNCHIMTLSQITRMGKDEPKMSDLKESGALEQDNDYIMLLHRPYVLDKADDNPEEAAVLLDKNKYGITGKVNMRFQGEFQRFGEIDNRY